MSVIRDLRRRAGVTQSELAQLAGTSQPAIAAYEAGRKSPRLSTVERIARAAGLEVSWRLVPPLTRTDRRSLALHTAIADALEREPERLVEHARARLVVLRAQHPHARALFDAWERWLRLPTDELVDRMLDPSVTARDMRQVTPFAGALSTRARARAYRSFARQERQTREA